MKKFIFIILILISTISWSFANDMETLIRGSLDELARQYTEQYPQIYSRRTVSVIGINNVTDFAEKNYIGQTLEELIKISLEDSLIFSFVDRALLDAAIEELSLSLSGMTDESTAPEIGNIENVQLLLSGSVFEEGDSFIMTLNLTDVETTKRIAVTKQQFPKKDLILRSEEVILESIVANGVGFSLDFSPLHSLVFSQEPHAAVGESQQIEAYSGESEVSYRISKNLKVGLALNIMGHALLYDTCTFGEAKNIPDAGKAEAYVSEILQSDGSSIAADQEWLEDQALHYQIEQMIFNISLPVSYVWIPHRKLSVSFKLGPSFNVINFRQVYDSIPVREGTYVTIQRLELERSMTGIGFLGGINGEFFFLPRMALNLGCSYLYNYYLPNQNPYTKCTSNGEGFYGYEDRSFTAFGLNPFMLPDGRTLDENLFSANYFKVFLGISLYY